MRSLSDLGIGLSLVFGCLFLALLAEVYYLLWWKKRVANRDIGDEYSSSAREFVDVFCWKKLSSLSSTALNPRESHASARITDESVEDTRSKPFGGEDQMESDLMMVDNISVLPRLLFTIKEETREDLESEDGQTTSDRSRSSRGGSLSDVLVAVETPYMTPITSPPFFTPPLTPMNGYSQQGFNPLFESSKEGASHWIRTSPPPKFKFLRDAEEKLYRKTLMEEALKIQNSSGIHQVNLVKNDTSPINVPCSSPSETSGKEEDGSFITISIGKNQEIGQRNTSSLSPMENARLPFDSKE